MVACSVNVNDAILKVYITPFKTGNFTAAQARKYKDIKRRSDADILAVHNDTVKQFRLFVVKEFNASFRSSAERNVFGRGAVVFN